MKPDILSKKRLDALHIERNKLELATKYRSAESDDEEGDDKYIEKWDEDLEQLTHKLRDLREKTGRLNGATDFKSELMAKEVRIKELEAKLGEWEGEIDDVLESKSEIEHQNKELRNMLEIEQRKYEAQIKLNERDIQGLKKRLEGMADKHIGSLTKNEKDVSILEERILDLMQTAETREREVLEREKSIKNLQEMLKTHGKEIELSLTKSKNHITVQEDLINALKAKKIELNELKKRFNESQDSLKVNIKARKDTVETMNRKITTLEKAHEQALQDIETKRGELIKLKTKLHERQIELSELEKDRKLEVRQQKEVVHVLEGELQMQEKQIALKEKKIQDLKNKLESWHASIRDELDEAIEFITQQSEEISRLKTELEVRDAKSKDVGVQLYRTQ